jgi:hypothetical protein
MPAIMSVAKFARRPTGVDVCCENVPGTECKPCDQFTPAENGRTGEIRTRDQRIKSPLLYRLSYRPIFMALQNNDPRAYWIVCCQKETFGNI